MNKNNEIIKTILVTAGMVLCCSFSALASTSANIEEATVVEILPQGYVDIDDVGVRTASKYINLHESPSNEAPIIAVIPRGEQVVVLGRESGFIKVSYKDLNGYIGDQLLMTNEEYQSFMDSIPYHEEIPLDKELQKYFYLECLDTGTDYAFALSIVDIETGGTFNPNIISKTNDYGLFQCNGCWKSTFKKLGLIQDSMKDLLNPYNSIHAGLYLLSQYQAEFGVSEAAAVKYNRGNAKASSSTPYSRKVMYTNYPKWKAVLEQ